MISSVFAFGAFNPLMSKNSGITDIGQSHGNLVEVPFEKINVDPTITIINGVIVYSKRIVVADKCVTDKNGNEYCPMKRQECQGSLQYTNSSSTVHTNRMSCSNMNINASWDDGFQKCVITPKCPAGYTLVKDSNIYPDSKTACVKTVTTAPIEGQPVQSEWSWCDSCGDYITSKTKGIPHSMLPIVQIAGGSSVSLISSGTDVIYFGRYGISFNKYLLSTDATRPITIIVGNTNNPNDTKHAMVTYKPGDSLYFVNAGYPYIIYNGTKYFTNGTNTTYGGIDKPNVYTSAYPYSCPTGYTPVSANGQDIAYCEKQDAVNSTCDNPLFAKKYGNWCGGDKAEYTYYTYSCPNTSNEYGSEWNVIEKGGDCGEYNLQYDTDGDGLNDSCNLPSSPPNNCVMSTYKCPTDSTAKCVQDSQSNTGLFNFSSWITNDALGRWTPAQNDVVYNGIGKSMLLSNYLYNNSSIVLSTNITGQTSDNSLGYSMIFGYKNVHDYYEMKVNNSKIGFIKHSFNSSTNTQLEVTLKEQGITPDAYANLINGNLKLAVNANSLSITGKGVVLSYTSTIDMDLTGQIGFIGNTSKLGDTVRFYSSTFNGYTNPPNSTYVTWLQSDKSDLANKTFVELINNYTINGSYKASGYEYLSSEKCSNNNLFCDNGINNITIIGNTFYFEDRNNKVAGGFAVEGNCNFSGFINENGIDNTTLFSRLWSANENYYTGLEEGVTKVISTPSNQYLSLDFNNTAGAKYNTGYAYSNPSSNDKITISFLMNFRYNAQGDNVISAMPVALGRYNLWLKSDEDKKVVRLGFNTGNSDLYGITNFENYGNSWHRVTAVFTQGDVSKNELYIDGVKQSLSKQKTNGPANTSANISGGLTLGTWSLDNKQSYNGGISGLLVYKGALSQDEVKALSLPRSYSGISRLIAYGNKIMGYDINNKYLGSIESTCKLSGKVGTYQGDPITSAVVRDNRIEFWGQYENKGSLGYIEILKEVSNADKSDGYVHEFKDIEDMYAKGFVGIKTYNNGLTYAISKDPISITQCQNLIKGTTWYLGELSTADYQNNYAINSLSFEHNGGMGGHCIISTKVKHDNFLAKYGVKLITGSAPKSFYCSGLKCTEHICGTATCPNGFTGNILKEEDKAILQDKSICVEQECDINKKYFKYCGNPNGCDTKEPSVFMDEASQCKQMTCPNGGTFNPNTKSCETVGCKYIQKGDKCYKKLY